jgi:Tfp pilus assembly protein PilE
MGMKLKQAGFGIVGIIIVIIILGVLTAVVWGAIRQSG